MAAYEDEGVFPVPIDKVWSLLEAHWNDARIHQIHPEIESQTSVRREGENVVLDRLIDARGKKLRSRWKYTLRPPGFLRWEVTQGEGPWSPGTWIENRYTPAPGGTQMSTRGELRISVLPFFLPQGPVIRRVFRSIDAQDLAFAQSL